MYEVMGGNGSMSEWVDADPSLAAADYVHFTTKGANKMAASFYEALKKDYAKYLETTLTPTLTDSTLNEK